METNGRVATRLRERYGPWALVTGASSGIGRATARRLAAAGVGVVLVARDAAALAAVAAEVAPAASRVVVADLSEADGPARVLAACSDLDLGLLVAAAGFGTSGDFLEADLEAEQRMLDVNCRAVLALSHGVGRRMAARGSGGIVLLGSVVGYQGTPRAAHYAATKAYVQTLAEGLHVELRPRGVDVLVSAPGPVHSGFAGRAGMTLGRALDPDVVAAGTLAALGRRSAVSPGALSKLLGWSLAPLPRSARTRILGRVMAGMTPHGSTTPSGGGAAARGPEAGGSRS